MKVYINPNKESINQIIQRPLEKEDSIEAIVTAVLEKVKSKGDEALKAYTLAFDKVTLKTIAVTRVEIEAAKASVSSELKRALKVAYDNIKLFHESQKLKEEIIETTKGVKCWQKSIGIEKVGLYIPGGSAPLFSTVLMLAIPAQIAGCQEIILCTPPQKNGTINPAILYAAELCGITHIFKVGGAQAIAAMAYGTESIPAVYKIFGPGNQYVTTAKQLVNRAGVGIDMPAGPSEVMVVADEKVPPAFVAADLLSQAEHGEDSQVVLVAFNQETIQEVLKEITNQLTKLPRQIIAQKALENSRAIVVSSKGEALNIINEYAPEHLILAFENPEELISGITNAGSVFIGNYTPESVGDYASGTNHTLPTNGYAKTYSGLNLDAFVKKITFQQVSKEGLKSLGPIVEIMAEAEQLIGHKEAVSIRLNYLNQQKD